MVEQKKKFRLDELHVESFVTSPNAEETKGGTISITSVLIVMLAGCMDDPNHPYNQIGPGGTASGTANAGCDTKLDAAVVYG